jgi:rhomboid protease GluP
VFKRQRTGSVICTSCGVLVGVGDERCYNCSRWNPGLWGWAPAFRALGQDLGFVPFVIGACIVVYALMLVFSRGSIETNNMFALFSPSTSAMVVFGGSGAYPIFELGRWWTVLSAGWLHAGPLHIFFNMLAARQLAPAVADLFGPGRMIIIYIAGSLAGFTASSLAGEFLPRLPFIGGGAFTVGASASISALIGAMLAYGHRSGSGMARTYAMQNVVMLVIMGVLIPFVDNWAHLGGFAGGYVTARTLDPLKPERIDHLAMAVVLLAVSLLSVVWSVLHAFYF